MTDEVKPEVTEGSRPERGQETGPDAQAGPLPDLTPQIVRRVRQFYEDLGRENVRAVEDLEKAKRKTGKGEGEAAAEPVPAPPDEIDRTVTEGTEPEVKAAESQPQTTAKPRPERKEASTPNGVAEPQPEATAGAIKIQIKQRKKWLIPVAAVLILAALGAASWFLFGRADKDKGLVSGNGRIEAVEIAVAAKTPGRVKDILVREGGLVTAGQVIALMDTEVLNAQHRQAEAQLRQAQSAVLTARSQLVQRESEKEAVLALVRQREAELAVARKRALRSRTLASEAATSQQEADDDSARVQSSVAAVSAARAQLAAAGATIVTAQAEIGGAQSNVEAMRSTVERITADINDSSLKSPREGRVQYRLAQPGEVVGAGGRVLSLVDLSDVYMTFFLPTAVVGRIALGTEVRLVLDAAPQHVIPAQVSFIADVAQFTPKTVETASERQKLMFRVRAQIPPELLRKHTTQVKTGLPGMAYIRLDPAMPWPAHLQVKP